MPLRRLLGGHEVRTAAEVGEQRTGDESLLIEVAGRFDVVVSVDRRFGADSTVPASVAVVILRAPSNAVRDLSPLVPALLVELAHPRRGARTEIGPLAG